MMKCFVLVLVFSMMQLCYAEIKVYQATDNTGINKKEQIDVIEKYLIDLSGQLKNIETKVDAGAIKIKTLETTLSTLKDNDIKKLQDQIANAKKPVAKIDGYKTEDAELEKLKTDILAIKNNDIESLREDINGMRFSIKNIQGILKIP
jgi:hypothetical protein